MKILAIIIAYNPSIDELTTNVSSFINSVDRLILWDNSAISVLKSLFLHDRIDVFSDGQNRGIAYPINEAVKIMNNSEDDYTHLLTLDQDSTWINFSDYLNEIQGFFDENIIFSPNINKEYTVRNCSLEVNYCITSGALFSKSVLKKIGSFNEEYSVDCVDYDFCFKARNNGAKIIKIMRAELSQKYGIEKKHRIFRIRVNEYSSNRLFFIVRNHVFLFIDYPHNFDKGLFFSSLKNFVLVKIPKILLMESDKYDKVKSILKGLKAGIKGDRSRSY
jgi:rhamnosyltransferase